MTSKEAFKSLVKNYEIEKECLQYRLINEDLNKLAKVKRWVNRKIDYLENGVFLAPQGEVGGAIKILKELKEVLNDE